MAVKVDYYGKLDVPRDADVDAINEAIRGKQRQWRKATNSPDMSTRHEAETWWRWLNEASDTLTNPQRRSEYDRELNTSGVQAEVQPQGGGGAGTDWVAQARDSLGRGDYHSAAYAAREATHTIGNSAESWSLRSRANAGLGNAQDALYEAKQATTIETNNAEYHFQLGMVQEDLDQYPDAMSSYQVAMRLDPSAPQYMVAVASVMADTGQVDPALDLIRQNLQRFDGEQLVHDYYAYLLLQKAESIPRKTGPGTYVITSKDEIDAMRPLLAEAKSHSKDPDLDQDIQKTEAYVNKSEERTFNVPGDSLRLKALILFSPLILILIGAVAGGGGATALFICLGLLAGVGVYFLCWVPRYKVASRMLGV
jgi:tetratricopeptide (TPR) repeat protein